MVATEHDRHASGTQFGVAGAHQRLVPGHHFVQMPVAGLRCLPGIARAIQVAQVAHLHTAADQGLVQSGDA